VDTDANATAESSTAVQAEPIEVEELNDEQRTAWQKTGELPAKEIKSKSGESTPSKPGEPAKTGDAKTAESGTAKPAKEKADQEKNWRNLEADRDSHKKRADSLEARIKELEARDGKTNGKPAESSSAPTEKPTAPVKPKRADFATDEEYEKAYEGDYLPKKAAFDAATKAFEQRMVEINKRHEELTGKWKGIKDEGEKLYGAEGWKKAANAFDAFNIYSGDPLEVYVRESSPDIGAHFLQYMSLKPKDVERIIKLPPGEQWKELWAIEVAMKEELKLQDSSSKPPAEKPKPKLVSEALPPPKEVGGKGTAAEDEETAAIRKAAAGDPSDYMALTNKREIAKRKAGAR
jgi:hypothetical protein